MLASLIAIILFFLGFYIGRRSLKRAVEILKLQGARDFIFDYCFKKIAMCDVLLAEIESDKENNEENKRRITNLSTLAYIHDDLIDEYDNAGDSLPSIQGDGRLKKIKKKIGKKLSEIQKKQSQKT